MCDCQVWNDQREIKYIISVTQQSCGKCVHVERLLFERQGENHVDDDPDLSSCFSSFLTKSCFLFAHFFIQIPVSPARHGSHSYSCDWSKQEINVNKSFVPENQENHVLVYQCTGLWVLLCQRACPHFFFFCNRRHLAAVHVCEKTEGVDIVFLIPIMNYMPEI